MNIVVYHTRNFSASILRIGISLLLFFSCILPLPAKDSPDPTEGAIRNFIQIAKEGEFFYLNLSSDSIIRMSEYLLPTFKENEDYDLYFQVSWFAIETYLRRGDVNVALRQAQCMLKEAKECHSEIGKALGGQLVGCVLRYSADLEQSLVCFEGALERFKKIKGCTTYQRITLTDILDLKITRGTKADLATCPTLFRELEALIDFSNYKQTLPYYFLKGCYAIKAGYPQQALAFQNQIEQDSSKKGVNPVFCRYFQLYLQAEYKKAIHDNKGAIQCYDSLIRLLEKTPNNTAHYQNFFREEADLYKQMGLYKEATLCLKLLKSKVDSLRVESYPRQIKNLRTIYRFDQLEMANKKQQNQMLLLIFFLVLLILVIAGVLYLYLRQNAKELYQSQLELAQANQKAERSIRTKSFFLSNMSHEIRTPLNAVVGFSSLLSDDNLLEEERDEYNKIILSNSELLLKLINDIIDLSSLEIGEFKFNKMPCEVIRVCRDVVSSIEQIKHTQAAILFESPLKELMIDTDKGRLQQILINIIINATKFTPQGKITLAVRQLENQMVEFSITDTGCGIPPEKRGQIFDRFEKLDDNVQGFGLGLSICQLMIRRLGGDIWVNETYSTGSRFVFTHPVK